MSGATMAAGSSARELRLADLLTGLSLVSDLAMGHDREQAMRTALMATLLAQRMRLSADETRDVYYTALLEHIGCTAFAHETTLLFGDDVRLNQAGSRTDLNSMGDMFATFLPELNRGTGPMERLRNTTNALLRGARFGLENNRAVCEVGREAARRLGLPAGVQRGVHQALELWSGRGAPQGLRGEEIALAARVVCVAGVAALFAHLGGLERAVATVRARSGGMLDPTIADAFLAHAGPLVAEVIASDPREALLELEPSPAMRVPEADISRAARTFGELVDLKSPYLHGHATDVARLVMAGGQRLRLGGDDLARLELAALLHDIGRAAVPTRIWEKPSSLTAAEWELVRLHPYHTERILGATGALAGVALIAGAHHERGDGSGYHRGLRGIDLSPSASLLAAADAFAAMTADRAHRSALSDDEAAAALRADGRAARLDPESVEAALTGAGIRAERPARREWPADLTDREVEVLRLVAGGCSNREVARRLEISARTAEHHVQAIYAKLGTSSRAAAALFAMEHDLLR